MHLAEGILPLAQAAAFSAAGAGALAWSLRGEKQASINEAMPSVVMAGITSLLFAATLLPLPVPVVGATSHICLTPVFALIVGVRRIVWPTFFVLLLQALFFAHGGITTLGVNTITLGLIGPGMTVGLYALASRVGLGNATALAAACGAGGLIVYVTDAIVMAVALADTMAPTTTFITVVAGFAPIQLPLAIVEAAVSVAIVRHMATHRPDLLPDTLKGLKKKGSRHKETVNILFALMLAGCTYEGIDGTVFGAVAESAGRPPMDSIFDMSQGEGGLAMSVLILFGLGFVAGRIWEKVFHGGSNALPR